MARHGLRCASASAMRSRSRFAPEPSLAASLSLGAFPRRAVLGTELGRASHGPRRRLTAGSQTSGRRSNASGSGLRRVRPSLDYVPCMRFGVAVPQAFAFVEPGCAAAAGRAASRTSGSTRCGSATTSSCPRAAVHPREHARAARLAGLARAARTHSITLGTSVLVLPYRDPVFLAKHLASIDVLSGGRLVVGVGVGWLEEEFTALGAPFDDRGAMTDEYLRVLRNLWETETSSFDGRWKHYDRMRLFPKGCPGAVRHHPARRRRQHRRPPSAGPRRSATAGTRSTCRPTQLGDGVAATARRARRPEGRRDRSCCGACPVAARRPTAGAGRSTGTPEETADELAALRRRRDATRSCSRGARKTVEGLVERLRRLRSESQR